MTNLTNGATPAPGVRDELHNREITLIAHFALAGHSVHRLADGGFLVCRFGHARHCPDLAALAGFARQTGVVGVAR